MRAIHICFLLFFAHYHLYYLRICFFSSDPGPYSRLFFPLPTTVRAIIFRLQTFLPSSTRIELRLLAYGYGNLCDETVYAPHLTYLTPFQRLERHLRITRSTRDIPRRPMLLIS